MTAPRVRGASGEPVPADETARAFALLGGTVTAARRAIVTALLVGGRLRTPEALLQDVRVRAPGTSLATVYRTLERLNAAGALKRATLASGDVGYAYCPTGHHEHAICLQCGQLRPIRPCVIPEPPPLEGFSITSHVLDFYGTCAACAVLQGDAAPPGG